MSTTLAKRLKVGSFKAGSKATIVTRKGGGQQFILSDGEKTLQFTIPASRFTKNKDPRAPKATRTIGKARGKTFKKTRARIGKATTAKRLRRLDLRRSTQREFGSDFNIFQVGSSSSPPRASVTPRPPLRKPRRARIAPRPTGRRKTPLKRQRNRDVRAGSDFDVLKLF